MISSSSAVWKTRGRALLRGGVVASGMDRLARYWLGGRGVVLMLHRVRQQPAVGWDANPGLSVTAQHLAAVITLLRGEGYDIITLDQACDRLETPTRSGHRFACLTFDDGYADNDDVLLPILQEYQAPALIYIATGFQDGQAVLWELGIEHLLKNSASFALPLPQSEPTWSTTSNGEKDRAFNAIREHLLYLNPTQRLEVLRRLEQRHGLDFMAITQSQVLRWQQIRSLANSGLVAFGAHSVRHLPLSRLETDDSLMEMRRSQVRLEQEISRPVVHFAYPYGTLSTVSRREPSLAAQCGFRSAALSWGGVVQNHDNPLALPRIAFSQQDSLAGLRLRLSGLATLRGPGLQHHYNDKHVDGAHS